MTHRGNSTVTTLKPPPTPKKPFSTSSSACQTITFRAKIINSFMTLSTVGPGRSEYDFKFHANFLNISKDSHRNPEHDNELKYPDDNTAVLSRNISESWTRQSVHDGELLSLQSMLALCSSVCLEQIWNGTLVYDTLQIGNMLQDI
ncbi:hypothetical protein K435DRAFT_788914 [Dendrothele bispora CBS 962.96]|uniref:Uncharacterized protein n=1 Tax=Dendrothele bispora (strain CBS 962.96) TaxID=1314807 RepID=A0A4S8MVN2_DENBC|nr:hypothetical protein K435DRAFT_788914 [Dendrothele bispora CBS 962.96]